MAYDRGRLQQTAADFGRLHFTSLIEVVKQDLSSVRANLALSQRNQEERVAQPSEEIGVEQTIARMGRDHPRVIDT